MKIYVLCDDYYHPARTVRSGLAPLEARGVQALYGSGGPGLSSESLKGVSVVVLAKANHVSAKDTGPWLDPDGEQTLVGFVHQGGGLLVVHSGTVGYRDTPALGGAIGGSFAKHPEQCPVTLEPVVGHPILDGVSPYTVQDEHYFVELTATDATVLARTSSDTGTQAGCWVRRHGSGRVCVFTPGHNLDVWLHPQTQVILDNALRWCAAAP